MSDENLILSIIKNSKEVITAIDLDGKVILWNNAAEELFSLKEEEVKGKLYPLVQDEHSYELQTVLEKTKNKESLTFRSQKHDKNGVELDLIFNTSPLYENDIVIGASIIIQQSDLLKKINYLQVEEQPESREAKRTFEVIRDIILLTIGEDKKTINQVSTDSGINWRTVEKHLTYLIGKKLVSEIFSSEYVRIFELTKYGLGCVNQINREQFLKYTRKI